MNHNLKNSRFELKYRLHYIEYLQVRNAITPYMKKDPFTKAEGEPGYLVRSLYFDTDDYASYHEKMAGNSQRLKLRIRSYSSKPDSSMPIKAELKIRQGNLVVKKSQRVDWADYAHFMETGRWDASDHDVLMEFEGHALSKQLRPKVLIEYRREGYQSRLNQDLRITFDHKVKSAHGKDLFPKHIFFREHIPHHVIMEIKFKDQIPVWVKNLVFAHGLKVIANIKFTQAIQASRHDLAHPDGVAVIR